MVREPAMGFITEVGTRTSHTAIMARALEIPAVVGAADALLSIRTGDMVIVDGLRGEVIIHPDGARLDDARARSARHLAFARGLLSARDQPSVTADGTPVALKANVELPAEAILAVDHGAEGIGLYRTEFLYIDRTTQPDEQEQYELYRAVLEAVAPKPVTLRTFDIGGDKFASSFQLPAEMNPALGLRAVRLALKQPEVFLTQLRAMVRASAHGDLRIMVPMVSSIHEMREVRKLLDRAMSEVGRRGQAHAREIPLGMMVEVPAAAVMADVFAREAQFFSLGTNDLVQYTLAIDRASRTLATQASPLDPSILRLIANVVKAGVDSRHPGLHLRRHGVRPARRHAPRRPRPARALHGGRRHPRDQGGPPPRHRRRVRAGRRRGPRLRQRRERRRGRRPLLRRSALRPAHRQQRRSARDHATELAPTPLKVERPARLERAETR